MEVVNGGSELAGFPEDEPGDEEEKEQGIHAHLLFRSTHFNRVRCHVAPFWFVVNGMFRCLSAWIGFPYPGVIVRLLVIAVSVLSILPNCEWAVCSFRAYVRRIMWQAVCNLQEPCQPQKHKREGNLAAQPSRYHSRLDYSVTVISSYGRMDRSPLPGQSCPWGREE